MEYLITVIACLLVISLSVFINEINLSKLRNQNFELANLSVKVAIDSERMVENQRILIEILEDNFTEEEIKQMIKDKRDKIKSSK